MSSEAVSEDFADGKRWEMALIVQLIMSPDLYRAVQDFGGGLRLEVEDFAWTPCKCVYEALQTYYGRFKDTPSIEIVGWVADEIALARQPGAKTPPLIPEELPHLKQILATAQVTQPASTEFYAAKVHEFVRMRRLQNLTSQFGPLMNRGVGGAEFVQEVAKLRDTGATTRQFGQNRGFEQISIPLTTDDQRRVSTGIKGLDVCLNGGLAATELGIVVGVMGTGKTNTLLHMLVAAAERGWHGLFISLEMPLLKLKPRYYAMAAHIPGSVTLLPAESWPASDIVRLQLAQADPTLAPSVAFEELCGPEKSLALIEKAIIGWHAEEDRRYGSHKLAGIVCIDYLDELMDAVQRTNKGEGNWEVLKRISSQLAELAKKHGVAIWTASQGNKDAVRARKVGLEHMSGAFLKSAPAQVVLGLSLSESALQQEDAVAIEPGMTDCDRTLVLNLAKNRDGPKGKITVYQGRTLRLWDSESAYQHAMKMAADRFSARTLFGNGMQGGGPT